jgi:hypothetical protein
MKTSILYYFAFAVVVLNGVLFGLDWQSATMSPMPPIQVVALPPPPPPAKIAVPIAAPNPAAPSPAAPSPVVPAIPVAPNPVTARPVTPSPVAQTPPQPKCDVTACAAAYRSFRESDCTYNPSVGPRQLCTKGVVPSVTATMPASPPALDTQPSILQEEPNKQINAQPATPPNTKCNVSACAAAYRSFRESDCTFNPSIGPRQLCVK